MPSINFACSCFGSAHAVFLPAHLLSISKLHPYSKVLIIYDDIPITEIQALNKIHPRLTWKHEPVTKNNSNDRTIAQKCKHWEIAAIVFGDTPIAILDCDTILLKNIDHLANLEADFIYTVKNDKWPINTGVFIINRPTNAIDLLKHWQILTEQICSTHKSMHEAMSQSGGADQHALRQIMGIGNEFHSNTLTINNKPITTAPVECSKFNETRSISDNGSISIAHFKGGWRPILFGNTGYSQHRTIEGCKDLAERWHNLNNEANGMIAASIVSDASRNHHSKATQISIPYEPRGILNSEMLAVASVSIDLSVEVIIESGRCRGQSTAMLGEYFRGQSTEIHSVELIRDDNATFAEKRLSVYNSIHLHYGNAFFIIPQILKKIGNKKTAILLDGPKSWDAVNLLKSIFKDYPNVVCGFIHDTARNEEPRTAVSTTFPRSFFTDDNAYVEAHKDLDTPCIIPNKHPDSNDRWSPYRQGEIIRPSYGPTLSVILPIHGVYHWLKKTTATRRLVNSLKILTIQTIFGVRCKSATMLRQITGRKSIRPIKQK